MPCVAWADNVWMGYMSTVPKSRRKTARTEFVYNAAQLFSYTLDCVMKLPKRWTFCPSAL